MNNRMSNVLGLVAIATFIAAWFAPTYELFVLCMISTAINSFVAIYSRTIDND